MCVHARVWSNSTTFIAHKLYSKRKGRRKCPQREVGSHRELLRGLFRRLLPPMVLVRRDARLRRARGHKRAVLRGAEIAVDLLDATDVA